MTREETAYDAVVRRIADQERRVRRQEYLVKSMADRGGTY